MESNVEIKFNLDCKVKVYFNDELIDQVGFKDTSYYLIEEDSTITFKAGMKRATIRAYKDRNNKIEVGYSTTGQLKAEYFDSKANTPKVQKQEKVEGKVDNQQQANVAPANTNNSSNGGIVGGCLSVVFVIIMAICFWDFLPFSYMFSGPSNSPEENARLNAESLLKKDKADTINSLYAYGTNHPSVGKVTSASCTKVASDSVGRYIFDCSFKYNPQARNGMVDTTKEGSGNIYVSYLSTGDGYYSYNFGSLYYSNADGLQTMKDKSCWEKPKSSKVNCRS